MRRGRPKSEVETCVLAVRIPVALRDELDRYRDALETRLGLTAKRTAIIRHALRLFLKAQEQGGLGTPPHSLQADRPTS
jgi:hypothetical protein